MDARGKVLALFMEAQWKANSSAWEKGHDFDSKQYLYTGAFDEWKTVLKQ